MKVGSYPSLANQPSSLAIRVMLMMDNRADCDSQFGQRLRATGKGLLLTNANGIYSGFKGSKTAFQAFNMFLTYFNNTK